MLDQQIPEELFATNISTGQVPQTVVHPVGLLNPLLDGRSSSYFEWLPAGIVETAAPSGTMTSGERHEPAVKQLLFGFDLENLYLRFDLNGPAGQKLAEGTRCSVNFTVPPDRRLVLFGTVRGPVAELHQRTASGNWAVATTASPRVAAAEILEAALPFADLGLRPNNPFAFFVSIQNGGLELERHPTLRPVESFVPEPAFERLNWKA
jgi:hypothetical protein